MRPGSVHVAPGRPGAGRIGLRLLLLVPGGASLVLGLAAALDLLGWPNPIRLDRLAQLHAPLLVFGFAGTLIVLERAVAARRWWGFLAPAALGLGSLSLLTPVPDAVGKLAVIAGFALLLAVYTVVWRRAPAAATAIQVLGAVAALAAAVLWLAGLRIPDLVPGMAVFLVLTIAGERLELGRISPTVTTRVEAFGVGIAIVLTASVVVAPLWPLVGFPLLGASLLVLVAWLARFDVATRLVRSSGLPRYMAVCLLAGYAWLEVAGVVWLAVGEPSGWAYDAVLHAVFLGFVMSMIMAHAPVILPAVLRVPLPYRPFLFVPVVLLHASLAVRVIGDARAAAEVVRWAGAANIAAVLLFAALAVTTSLLGVPARARPEGEGTAEPGEGTAEPGEGAAR